MALLAAQMYTLRDFCKTSEDLEASLKRVKNMGYDGVQLSGCIELPGDDMKKMLDDIGLVCCATHVGIDKLENETDAVIERHQKMGCKYTAIGGFFPPATPWDKALWTGFAARLNAVAEKFAPHGIKIGYHNHSQEFCPAEGLRPLDILISELNKETTWMEIDTYWIQHGGANPADYIKRVAGRIPCVHLKDMATTPQRTQVMTEVGDGNLNWGDILQACRYAGVQWYIVERDAGETEPFASLERSYNNLREKYGL